MDVFLKLKKLFINFTPKVFISGKILFKPSKFKPIFGPNSIALLIYTRLSTKSLPITKCRFEI